MRSRRRAKRLAAGAGVALATSGLSTCNDNGAVDPPPPPFTCDNNVAAGVTLSAVGVLSGRELRITIQNHHSQGYWTEVSVLDTTGGVARPVTLSEPLVVVIDLHDEATTGSFTFSGVLRGLTDPATCRVARTFTFTIQSGDVVIARRDLPLEERQPTRIALVHRDGGNVELDVGSPGTGEVHWSVTGGRILSRDGTRLRWRLPARPGIYQAELVVDHGRRGLSFDTLALVVEPPDRGSAT